MRRRLFCLSFLLLTGIFCYAQSPELDRLRVSLTHQKDSLNYVDVLNRMAMLFYEKSVDSTFVYTTTARRIAERHDYAKGKADALNNLGVVFDIKGNLQLALRYYDEAHTGYRRLGDSANQVQTLMNIAMVYKEIGKDERAVSYFKAALNLGRHLKQDSIMSLAIYNYLLAYPAGFSHDSVSFYVARARRIAAHYKDQRTLVAIDQLVADDLIGHGSREKGLSLLDSTITAAIHKNLYYVSMDMLIDMGDQLEATEPEKAADYYRKGLAIAQKNSYLFYSRQMARKLFDLYALQHNNNHAASYGRQYLALQDQQEKLDNASSIDYLDYAIKEQQVDALTARSKYQTILLVLALATCILAIAVIILVRRALLRSRQTNEQVNERNRQMSQALQALEQSQSDNTKMMQIAAHDLRNPVGAIVSLSSMLLDNEGYAEEDRTMLELIRTSATNSLELVSDLLHVQFNTEDLKKEPVNIEEMLRYCVSLLLNKAQAKRQQISLKTIPLVLNASGEKLWRVISNLIVNAIKFSPAGATINVKMHLNTESALIVVQDHGIGIPLAMQDKIFDMFTEARRPGTAGEQPFGLGLAISKQIVEAHNGKIWFDSKVDSGTTFYISLPCPMHRT